MAVKRVFSGQDTKAFLIIFFILLLAYAIPPFLHRSQNPIYQRSGLATQISSGLVNGQNTIDPNDGFTSQALGHAAAESWLSGDLPYWNHYEGLGSPLAGEGQSAALFPLIILQHFKNGFLYIHFLLQLIAGMSAYLFFKRLKIRFSIAILGGVLFALNGAFAWLTNAPFNPIAFLPLLMLGIEHAVASAEKNKKGGWLIIALALALSLYSGFPEGAFINAIFAYGWATTRLLYLNKSQRKAYIYKIFLGSITGLLLAGPMLASFLGYLPDGITGGHQNGGYANASLPLKTLPALFMPYIFGPIFGYVNSGQPPDLFIFWSNVGGYITTPLVLMSLFGLYAKRPRGLKLYPAVFIAIVILKIYGFKPAAWLVNAIPGMNQVAFYRYSIPALAFALILLAVFGMEAFAKRQIAKLKIIIGAALMVTTTIAMALFARQLLHQLIAFPGHRLWALLAVGWSLALTVSVPCLMLTRKLNEQIKLLSILALLSIDVFTMFIVPQFSLPKMSPINYKPVSYLQKNLGFSRFYTLHPIAPNYGSYFEVASVNVNDLPVPKKWGEYVSHKLDKNVMPLVFTGYSRTDAAGPTALEEFGRNIGYYENVSTKYLITDPNQVDADFASQHGLDKVFSDQQLDIFKLPSPKSYFESTPNCVITNKNRDTLTATCRAKAKLVRRELYMPGWSTKINGRTQEIYPSQQIFQQVNLPKGKSDIKFLYNPPLIGFGYIALAAGFLIIMVEYRGYLLRVSKLK